MNSAVYLSLLATIISINIGFYVLLLNPKKNTNKVFSLLVLFFAIFCFSEFMVRISETKEVASIWGRIGYIIVPIVSSIGLHFSLVFPRVYPNYKNIFTRYKYSLHFLYLTGIILAITSSLLISVKNVQLSEWGHRVVLGNSIVIFITWLVFCTFFAALNLMHTYFKKNITIKEKKQIGFLTGGFLIIVIFSLGTNLIPPLFGFSIFPMTTVSLALFSFMVAYSMIRYRLMKLTTAETADVVIDTIADSLFVIDGNKTIINVNKSTLDLLGYTRKELMNVPLENIVNLPHFESNILSKVSADGRIKDIEAEFFTKERKSIPMNISASSIYNDRGELEGTVIVARDLTETKNFIHQLEEAKTSLEEKVEERTAELLKANKELEFELEYHKKAEGKIRKSQRKIELQNIKLKKLNQVKTMFLNTVSHELRTPITAIKGYAQILLKGISGKINKEQQKNLEVILQNTSRLDILIKDILDISRLESGTMKFVTERTDVRKMILDSVETMHPYAKLKEIKINTEFEDHLPELSIDKNRIKQVLTNIINNAIKFSNDGSAIDVIVKKEQQSLLFEIKDFGRGIPRDKLKEIFDGFYQVDSGEDRTFGGMGIGLAISRDIILSHGGKIWVESTVGKGSTFKFTIPLTPVKDVEERFKEMDLFGLKRKMR